MIIGAVWIALAGGALGIARLLDDEPQKPVVLVAHPPKDLPPLRLFLNRDLPPEVRSLTNGAAQAAKLQELATARRDPALWVDLGAFAQRAGDLPFAQAAFREALALDASRVDARVGLLMVDGATGAEGLARAADGLADLQAAHPTSQLVAFNTGMVAVYRGRRDDLVRAFRQAVELGPTTPLGRLARQLAAASGSVSASP